MQRPRNIENDRLRRPSPLDPFIIDERRFNPELLKLILPLARIQADRQGFNGITDIGAALGGISYARLDQRRQKFERNPRLFSRRARRLNASYQILRADLTVMRHLGDDIDRPTRV